MSRFEKLTHVLWHCQYQYQYHIVWVPKYRYRVLTGDVAREVHNCIQVYSSRLGCRVIELNVQPDHVHLLVKVPPKVPISKLLGVVKGKTALRIFTKFPYLRNKPYWGNHFWAKGYCVDTVGVDAEMIRKWFFSALMSELLSIFLPFAVCISRTSIWLVQAERG